MCCVKQSIKQKVQLVLCNKEEECLGSWSVLENTNYAKQEVDYNFSVSVVYEDLWMMDGYPKG